MTLLARRICCAAVAAVVAVTVGGCGAETPDYQSAWSTTTPPPTSAAADAGDKPLTISQYLESAGVTGNPVAPEKLVDLIVKVPTPGGWEPYQNPNFAPGTRMIVKGDTYPTAILMIFQLSGEFDVAKAIAHGDGSAEISENFKRLNASNENWRGFPSSMVEGSYDLNGRRMQTYSRIVIATVTPPNVAPQRYLVQLTVTSFADEAATHGPDIGQIISGFTVAAKT